MNMRRAGGEGWRADLDEARRLWALALDHLAGKRFRTRGHGPDHWARVERNGLHLCRCVPGADETVLRLFAAAHDAARLDDGADPEHGPRAARLLAAWSPEIGAGRRELLFRAVTIHTAALPPLELPPPVQVCLDADRLDIGRTGCPPRPEFLFTAAAKELASGSGVGGLAGMALPLTRPDLLDRPPVG
jgi:uncharacterized protein